MLQKRLDQDHAERHKALLFHGERRRRALVLDWTCEVDPAEPGWTLEQRSRESIRRHASREQRSACCMPLSDLVPDADYTFTVALKSGEKLEGETKRRITPRRHGQVHRPRHGGHLPWLLPEARKCETVTSTNISDLAQQLLHRFPSRWRSRCKRSRRSTTKAEG